MLRGILAYSPTSNVIGWGKFSLKFLVDTCPFWGATGSPVLDFWWCLLWVSKPEWFCLIHFFVEVNVMYIPLDPPPVLHMPTSWWPAFAASHFPHMHQQRWDLAQTQTGNHSDRRWTRYHCASDLARMRQILTIGDENFHIFVDTCEHLF